MNRRRRTFVAGTIAFAVGASVAFASFFGGTQVTQNLSSGSLPAVTDVTTTHPTVSGGRVDLTWTPSADPGVTSQQVLRATGEAGPYSVIATLGPGTSTYSDTTATYNNEFYYSVRAQRFNWTATSAVRSAHSQPIVSGINRVTGTGAGTALTGPWTTAGTNLAALVSNDAVRYQPTSWPAAPANMLGASYVDATHAWTSGSGTIAFFDGDDWTNQTPGTTAALEQVVFVDTQNGWTVGSSGVIRRTTNGGATWVGQTSGTTRNLRDIDCVSTTFCVAVGSNLTVRVTTNGGTTWVDESWAGGTTQLWDVDCVSSTTCWVVGNNGTLRRTTDGGTTWVAQSAGTTSALYGVSCLADALNCWVVGAAGAARRTTDGGATWTAFTPGSTANLRGIQMVSTTTGFITGDGSTVRRTTNGWSSSSASTVPTANYLNLSCMSAARCMVVSSLGVALMTHDGGVTWAEQASRWVEFTPRAPTVATTSPVDSVVARLRYRTTSTPGTGTRFILMASADNGDNWQTYDLPTPTAANTDVTAAVDISDLGFVPTTRASTLQVRFAAVPQGSTLSVQLDLAHIDIN